MRFPVINFSTVAVNPSQSDDRGILKTRVPLRGALAHAQQFGTGGSDYPPTLLQCSVIRCDGDGGVPSAHQTLKNLLYTGRLVDVLIM